MGEAGGERTMTEYVIERNKHGVFTRGGPRSEGPHLNVWDKWDTTPTQTRLSSEAECECIDCGARWPEGGYYPERCI